MERMFLSYCRPQIRRAYTLIHHQHRCYSQGVLTLGIFTLILTSYQFNSSTLYAHLSNEPPASPKVSQAGGCREVYTAAADRCKTTCVEVCCFKYLCTALTLIIQKPRCQSTVRLKIIRLLQQKTYHQQSPSRAINVSPKAVTILLG